MMTPGEAITSLSILFCRMMMAQSIVLTIWCLMVVMASTAHRAPRMWADGAEQISGGGRRTLRVIGFAEVDVKPDICNVVVSKHSHDAVSASKAYNTNARGMSEIVQAVELIGIHLTDMQTTNLHLSQSHRYDTVTGRNEFDGYSASQELTIKVRNMTVVSEVLAAAVNSGATAISAVQFDVEDISSHVVKARLDAIDSAQAKALQICQRLGLRLLKPITITEKENNYDVAEPDFISLKAARGVSVQGQSNSIQVGSSKISHQVSIVYEIA